MWYVCVVLLHALCQEYANRYIQYYGERYITSISNRNPAGKADGLKIPMSSKTIPSGPQSKLWLWLNANGYTTIFPCSIILYSRKAVYSFCRKMSLSQAFSEKDLVRKCVKWALIDRIGSVVDYRSRVWNNSSFPNHFKKYSVKKRGSRFNGLLWTTPAAYDKLVSIFIEKQYCPCFITF